MAVVLLGLLLALPARASALTGTQLLTFGDYGTGTEISTQYEGQGVVFKDEDGYYPEIRWDESASTNPTLSGTFGFGSPISAQFVVPGTTTPATVENLSMDVGYINEPSSTELVVDHASGGPFTLFANEFGFNHLFLGSGGISGFQLEPIGEEPAGFELDNLEYTIPAPPPPPPAPAPTTIAECVRTGNHSLGHEVLVGLKCDLQAQEQLAKCAVGVVTDFPELKGAKTATGFYDASKVKKTLRPVVKLYNDLLKMKIAKNAPKGFRSFGEIKDTFQHAHDAYDIAKDLVDLKKALDQQDFDEVVKDLADLAGVGPCLQVLKQF